MNETQQHKTPIRRLLDAIADPEATLTLATVDEINATYPYFTLADAILLQRSGSSLDPQTKRRLAEHLAINAPDPDTLFQLIDPHHQIWADFYPTESIRNATPTTNDAIDTFLNTYGHSDPAEEALLEKLIFNPPAPDYITLLESEQNPILENISTPAEELFPEFTNPQPDAVAESENNPQHTETQSITKLTKPIERQVEPSSTLSESLAKIYIRRRRYEKAYEIIHTLSLNNPKKSIYFADQLRFLRKLIINQQNKK